MAYSTYIELVDYFETLPTNVADLKGVTVGDDEALLNKQNSIIRYPHLRVATPEILIMGDDQGGATRYTFQLFLLTNEPTKTPREENVKLSSVLSLARKVLDQMWEDADADNFDMIAGDKQGALIRKWSGDNDFGCWFEVVIDLYTDECD